MTRIEKESLGQRLQGIAYWLAFSAAVALLWIVLPVQAAAPSSTTHAKVTAHTFPFNNHNNV